jgi:hypothetical protein
MAATPHLLGGTVSMTGVRTSRKRVIGGLYLHLR